MSSRYRILARRRSSHSRILVCDVGRGERQLIFEGTNAVQSVARMGAPGYPILPYVRALATALAILPPPRRALVVGLGAGTVPVFLRNAFPAAAVDVVEVDSVVVEVARTWFELPDEPRLRVVVGDGREFLEGSRRRWDMVILDAYTENQVPSHLTTREFLQVVRRRVAPGGAVLANIWGSATNRLYRPMLRTYQEVFADLWLVRPPRSGNRIVVALPEPATWTKERALQSAQAFREAVGLRFDPANYLDTGLERIEAPVPAQALADGP